MLLTIVGASTSASKCKKQLRPLIRTRRRNRHRWATLRQRSRPPTVATRQLGLQRLGLMMQQLREIAPMLGVGHEAYNGIQDFIKKVSKFVPPGSVTPAAQNQMIQRLSQSQQQNNQQMQALQQQRQQQQQPQRRPRLRRRRLCRTSSRILPRPCRRRPTTRLSGLTWKNWRSAGVSRTCLVR